MFLYERYLHLGITGARIILWNGKLGEGNSSISFA